VRVMNPIELPAHPGNSVTDAAIAGLPAVHAESRGLAVFQRIDQTLSKNSCNPLMTVILESNDTSSSKKNSSRKIIL
jgi:hypothetical protein